MSILDMTPVMGVELEEHPMTGETEEIVHIRWGDTDFGMMSDLIDDIEVWTHEFTEYAIAESFKELEPSIDVSTIAQILGDAHGIELIWEGKVLFSVLCHLLASLVTCSYLPTHDKWLRVSGDEMWEIIKSSKEAAR